jgi:flagellar basal-body rod protein FlgC
MGIFTGMRISASGLHAERTRMDVISGNIANVETTRGPNGGPYRRRQVVLGAWQSAEGFGPRGAGGYHGVRVVGVEEAGGPLPSVYNPGHPDADAEGYVLMPDVELPTEMADMMIAARAYEANAAAFRAGRDIIRQALSILA